MKLATITCLMLAGLLTALLAQDKIAPALLKEMDRAVTESSTVKALLLLEERLDIRALNQQLYARKTPLGERAYTVITALQAKASESQTEIRDFIGTKSDTEITTYQAFWIANIIAVECTPDMVWEFADRADVRYVQIDSQLERDEPVDMKPAPQNNPLNREPGLTMINAHLMWQAGITGEGTIVMNLDTGVNGNHPALNHKWRGNHVPWDQAWIDPAFNSQFPNDGSTTSSHGTHTMGTMCGVDLATGDTIGVAPGAEWIASNSLVGFGAHTSRSIESFQWAMDPDNNPATHDDMPAAIGNSWWDSNITTQCNPAVNPYIDVVEAVEASGIAIVFSAGNNGASPRSITAPKNVNNDIVSFWATGAVDASRNIASFSSRGPVVDECLTGDESLDIKPEASAHGVSVRSSQFDDSYGFLSGTSMACPHVVGAIALLREAYPNRTGWELKEALYLTATDRGATGEDNNYGMGIINVWAAFQFISDDEDPNPPSDITAYSDFTTPSEITINWVDPINLAGGDTLLSEEISIDVERDGEFIGSVPGGTEEYIDTGLIDGTEYAYTLLTRITSNDSLSREKNVSWIAGGSPVPAAPTEFTCVNEEPFVVLNWVDPAVQEDGTPMDDLSEIRIWRDGEFVASVGAGVQTFSDEPDTFGDYVYTLTSVDNEVPPNESTTSIEVECLGGPDNELPVIEHEQLLFAGIFDLPATVSANVSDNLQVDSVWVEYSVNEGAASSFHLDGVAGFYQGSFPFGESDVAIGDIITYSVHAQDNSTSMNEAVTDEFTFSIRENYTFVSTPNLTIPNNNAEGVTATLTVDGDATGTLQSVDLLFEATHPNLGDLSIYLTSPAGTEVELMARPGHPGTPVGNPGDHPNFTLDDQAEQSIETVEFENSDVVVGRFSPDPGALAAFAGEEASGEWTIRVTDSWQVNTGTLDSWGLIVSMGEPIISIDEDLQTIPNAFSLEQNYPNPFNPTTYFGFQIADFGSVSIKIYNIQGQLVKTVLDKDMVPGKYTAEWDATNSSGRQVASGIYLYRLSTETGFVQSRKMILLR